MKGRFIWMIVSALVFFSTGGNASVEDKSTDSIGNKSIELPENAWRKIQRHLEKSQYAILPDDKNWRGLSPTQGYKVEFSDDGLTLTQQVNDKQHTFGMSLSSWGIADDHKALKPAKIAASGQRIEYQWDSITEWYINRPSGLEQGFTVHQKPEGTGDIELALVLDGDLTPQLDPEGQSLSLSHNNQNILQYSGLKVWDANGNTLPSHMRLQEKNNKHTLLIRVSTDHAAYPITVDPTIYSEVKILKTNKGHTANAQFGNAVAIDDDILVVGAEQDKNIDQTWNGAVYLFGRNQGGSGNWGIIKKLIASDASDNDNFGISVSIDGTTLGVGSYNHLTGYGKVYIFERDFGGDNNWGEYKKIVSVESNGQYGTAISIQDDKLIVGAFQEAATATTGRGAVYIYDRNQGSQDNWGLIRKLSPTTGFWFGNPVSVDGGTLIVGSPGDNHSGFTRAGSVYVFERNYDPLNPGIPSTDNWGLRKRIFALDANDDVNFGNSVSIDGNTAIIGAYGDDQPPIYNIGSAYIFSRNTGGSDNWGQQKKLMAPNATIDGSFGWSVDISGDRVAVGARYTDTLSLHNSGTAYLFGRDTGGTDNWGEIKRFTAEEPAADDEFGFSIAIDGDTLVVGAYKDDHNGGDDAGSVFLFDRNQDGADKWGLLEKIIASDSGGYDGFGQSVTMDGDTIAVGSPSDILEIGTGAGSVHLFYRHHGGLDQWGEVAKVIASNAGAGDSFGRSVSLSGDLLAVGAYGKDIGPDNNVGAAYIFERHMGGTDSWGELKFITPADGAGLDSFGYSISINSDTLAVGAMGKDYPGADSAGGVYIYQRDQDGVGNWGEVKLLTASDIAGGDKFGANITLGGDLLIVGSPLNDNLGGNNAGAAYLFERDHNGFNYWGEMKKLMAVDGADSDAFGTAVSLHNNTVVVGAYGDDQGANNNAGSAYIFGRNQGGVDNWGQSKKLIASDVAADAEFGRVVGLHNDLIVVGSPTDNNSAGTKAGSAYLFQKDEGGAGNWGEITRLQASNAAENGYFGKSVAVHDDIVAVGAGLSYEANIGHLYLFKHIVPGITIGPTSGLITTESGDTALFDVVLNTQPTSSVTIDLSSTNENEGIVSPWSLLFNLANWDTPQSITITGTNDMWLDGDQPYFIVTDPAISDDLDYVGVDSDDVQVTNIDNNAGCVGSPSLILMPSNLPPGININCTADLLIKIDPNTSLQQSANVIMESPTFSIPGPFKVEVGSVLLLETSVLP